MTSEATDPQDPQPIGTSLADRSLRITTALSAEVVVLRERLAILEQVLAENGLIGAGALDGYVASDALAARFKQQRAGFLARVFGALRA
ncbi:hypothetical protein HT136_12740 [Novosphingobium profundi]|uniref:hypothetical protein n=1 Tax=Novosphingobium profundi TaxID=1774954 RepID=UPI001BDACBF4|nr:hypothetical protein [Novosphingobium profundi]MBT0669230.1 hypothetical protein [Novosphingobium profundi]